MLRLMKPSVLFALLVIACTVCDGSRFPPMTRVGLSHFEACDNHLWMVYLFTVSSHHQRVLCCMI